MGVDSIDLPAAQGYKNSFRQNNQDPKWTSHRQRKINMKVDISFRKQATFQITHHLPINQIAHHLPINDCYGQKGLQHKFMWNCERWILNLLAHRR